MQTDGNARKVDMFSSYVAMMAALFSFGVFCMNLGGMFTHGDMRLTLTIGETFGGLREIRDVFNSVTNFSVVANPVGVSHVTYPLNGPEMYWEYEDLERRGLITPEQLAMQPRNMSSVQDDPSLLRRVLRLAWCTSWPNTSLLPADKTPGCRCIADAYLRLVNVSGRPASGFVNVSAPWREDAASQVFRCWDKRQVRRSRACGAVCKTQVLGLSMFANIVMFLACLAFLMFVTLRWELYLIKFLFIVVGVLICIPFYIKYPESNSFNLVGIAVCLLYLTVSLHYELGKGLRDGDQESGPALMACFMVNLPLIMSAHAIQFGVSGYGRDIWTSVSFGVCGGVLGLILQVRVAPFFLLCFGGLSDSWCRLQRFFWSYKAWLPEALNPSKDRIQIELRPVVFDALTSGMVFSGALLVHLFVAYRFGDSPYVGNSWWVFAIYGAYVLGFALVLGWDLSSSSDESRGQLSVVQSVAISMTVFINIFLGTVSLSDVVTTHD